MNVPEMFGSMVFNDRVMREMLPKKVYQSLQNTMVEGKALDEDDRAKEIAHQPQGGLRPEQQRQAQQHEGQRREQEPFFHLCHIRPVLSPRGPAPGRALGVPWI